MNGYEQESLLRMAVQILESAKKIKQLEDEIEEWEATQMEVEKKYIKYYRALVCIIQDTQVHQQAVNIASEAIHGD